LCQEPVPPLAADQSAGPLIDDHDDSGRATTTVLALADKRIRVSNSYVEANELPPHRLPSFPENFFFFQDYKPTWKASSSVG